MLRTTYPQLGLFIDGRWTHDRSPCHEVRNPSTEECLGTVPGATPADLEAALLAAHAGFLAWRQTAPQERASLLLRAAGSIRVGDGFEAGVQMGPLANARRLAAMESLVIDATTRGARVATGGHRIGTCGYFFARGIKESGIGREGEPGRPPLSKTVLSSARI